MAVRLHENSEDGLQDPQETFLLGRRYFSFDDDRLMHATICFATTHEIYATIVS